MVVDQSAFSMELTMAALRGFGTKASHCCRNADDAQQILKLKPVDLMLVDCEVEGMDGHALVRWLRHSGLEPNAHVPIIMTASHVRQTQVGAVRDCGANFLLSRPFSASVVLERILWMARDNRPFLEAGDYKGPDRRFTESSPRARSERRADMVRLAALNAERAAEKEAQAPEISQS
ncbi:MAG: response regulator [Alphaproteobacteria bacterium]|nr:response regulator [Alphaproteobacteria bacterium]MBU2380472.1 response regulator [Alphaproteobacteria bacterium]